MDEDESRLAVISDILGEYDAGKLTASQAMQAIGMAS